MSDLDLIDQYLRGELSEKDQYKVQHRIQSDHLFAKRFEERKLVIEGIRRDSLAEQETYLAEIEMQISQQGFLDHAEDKLVEGIRHAERKRLKQTLATLESSMPAVQRPTVIRRIVTMQTFRIASAIAVLPVLVWLISSQLSSSPFERLANELFVPYGQSELKRSNGEDPGREAYLLYDYGRFKKAIPAFQDLYKREPKPDHLFFQGVCYLAINEPKSALAQFERIGESHQLWIPSLWYSAIAYLQMENEKAVRETLKHIQSDRHWIAERDDLLKKLDNLNDQK